MAERDAADIPVLVGGIIPEADQIFLREKGARAILTPGAQLADVVAAFRACVTAT